MAVRFHFLNVGDGDCTIIDFPARKDKDTGGNKKDARVMMVDIHHSENYNGYEYVINYYKQNFKYEPIFRFVCTHPHKDHLKGIKCLFEDSGIDIINFWDLEHKFEPEKEGSNWEQYKDDWEKYCELRELKDEEGLYVRRYWDHQSGIKYWDEDRIRILSPSRELHEHAHRKEDGTAKSPQEVDLNNMPYVLLINVNDIKILLTSDAEEKCWEYILKVHREKIKNIDILKAAHHGSSTGLHEEALKVMNPKYIIFSRSEIMDEMYGAEDQYSDVVPDATILKTNDCGNIILECSFDGNITQY